MAKANEKVILPTGEEMLCPIRYTLDVMGGKWKFPIICMLANGKPTRYSSIKRKLKDITNMMLAQSLKELESAGIIHREQYNEVPPRVEYTLTEKGSRIIPTLVKMAEWGAENMQAGNACSALCEVCQTIN